VKFDDVVKAVIVDDLVTKNGHRYTVPALEAMVEKIKTKRVVIAPNMAATIGLDEVHGYLLDAELVEHEGHHEVRVEGRVTEGFSKILSEAEGKLVLVPAGFGNLNEKREIGADYVITTVGPTTDPSIVSARILEVWNRQKCYRA
jgi:hypothetical protein